MQIAVVELPKSPNGVGCGSHRSGGPELHPNDEEWKPGLAKASGLWRRHPEMDTEGPHSSGVFPAVASVSGFTSANDVWRWVPPATDAPEGCVRMVVFQRGATWPPFLARDLSGGATTCIVSEVLGDGLSGLVQRVTRRAAYVDLPVTQLIWISGDTRRTAPHRWVKQLAEAIRVQRTVLVVQAQSFPERRRTGRRPRSSSGEAARGPDVPSWLSRPTGSD